MDRLVTRVNEIADSDDTDGRKAMRHMVAIFDHEIAELIRRDLTGENGLLRECGFDDIAQVIDDLTT